MQLQVPRAGQTLDSGSRATEPKWRLPHQRTTSIRAPRTTSAVVTLTSHNRALYSLGPMADRCRLTTVHRKTTAGTNSQCKGTPWLQRQSNQQDRRPGSDQIAKPVWDLVEYRLPCFFSELHPFWEPTVLDSGSSRVENCRWSSENGVVPKFV